MESPAKRNQNDLYQPYGFEIEVYCSKSEYQKLNICFRCRLRSTSHTERASVESVRFNVDKLEIESDHGQFRVTVILDKRSKDVVVFESTNLKTLFKVALPMLLFVLTNGVVDQFSINRKSGINFQ